MKKIFALTPFKEKTKRLEVDEVILTPNDFKALV